MLSRRILMLFLALAMAMFVVPSTAGSATAQTGDENCGEGGPWDLECDGHDQDPGKPGDPGDPDGPTPDEPEEGDTRTGYKYETCKVNNPNASEEDPGCAIEVQCEGEEEPTNIYTRPEVYHRAQGGWVWTGGGGGTEGGDGWSWQETICHEPEEYVPSSEEVWRAVRNLKFPGAETEIQPPNGRTLVDLETNFYTTSPAEWGPQDVAVGPATVQVRATVQEYHWDFDGPEREQPGSESVTESPGAPYPDGDVLHTYTKTGSYRPSVTLMYHVEWQYDGGGWQAFDELRPATASPATDLQVVEKINRLSK